MQKTTFEIHAQNYVAVVCSSNDVVAIIKRQLSGPSDDNKIKDLEKWFANNPCNGKTKHITLEKER